MCKYSLGAVFHSSKASACMWPRLALASLEGEGVFMPILQLRMWRPQEGMQVDRGWNQVGPSTWFHVQCSFSFSVTSWGNSYLSWVVTASRPQWARHRCGPAWPTATMDPPSLGKHHPSPRPRFLHPYHFDIRALEPLALREKQRWGNFHIPVLGTPEESRPRVRMWGYRVREWKLHSALFCILGCSVTFSKNKWLHKTQARAPAGQEPWQPTGPPPASVPAVTGSTTPRGSPSPRRGPHMALVTSGKCSVDLQDISHDRPLFQRLGNVINLPNTWK